MNLRSWISLALVAALSAVYWYLRPPSPFSFFPQGTGQFSGRVFLEAWIGHSVSLVFLLAWVGALLVWGRGLLRWFWPGAPGSSLRNDFGMGLGFVFAGSSVLGLGLLGLLSAWPVAFVLWLPVLIFCPWRSLVQPRIGMPKVRNPWLYALPVPILAAMPLILAPEGSWDALVYHLRFPSFWLMEHKHFLVKDSPFSAYPVLMEAHYLLALAFLGGEETAKMMHAACWLLVARLIWKGTRPLGSTAAYASSLLWLGIPLGILLAGVCYIDLATAWMTTLAAAVLFAGCSGRGPSGAVLAGVFAGGAFMTKYTGALAGLGALAVLLSRGWRPGLLALFSGAAAVSCGAWLFRNWIEFGNLVYPFFPRILGGVSSPALDFWTREQATLAVFSPWAIAKRLWHSLFADKGGLGVITGPLWLAVCVTALFQRRRSPLWLFFLPAFAAWLFIGLDVRFLLPFLPVAFMAASPAWTDRHLRIPLFAAAILIVPPGIFEAVRGSITQFDPLPPAVGLCSRDDSLMWGLTPSSEYFDGAREINARTPSKARIMMLNNVKSYYINRRCVVSHQHIDPFPLLRYARLAGSAEAMAKKLRQQGLTHVAYLPRAVASDVEGGNIDVRGKDAQIYVDWLRKWTSFEWRTGEYLVYSINAAPKRRSLGRVPAVEEVAVADAVGGKSPQESRALEMLKTQAPESSSLRVARAVRILTSSGRRTVEALPILEPALRDPEVSPMAWRGCGFAHLSSGDSGRAAFYYHYAARLAPSDANVRFEFGHALIGIGAREQGLAEIAVAVRLDPANKRYRSSLDSLKKGTK